MEMKGEGGRQRVYETGGTKDPGGGEPVGVTASVFTGTLDLEAHGHPGGVSREKPERSLRGRHWVRQSVQPGDG